MNAPMANTAAADIREVEAFLYMEARLADENRYDDWAALWTEDALYWLPANIDDYDPNFHISIIYDDRSRIQDRIDRLKSGGAWAQEPRSRMRRIVSNVELVPQAPGGDIEVESNFVLGELRRGLQTAYFARQVHRLRRVDGVLRMAYKKVMLINNNEPIHNLSFLV